MEKSGKQNILLIEDDDMLLQLYSDILSDNGYHIDTASNGIMALDKITNHHWDLILCDIVIPQMNGFDVINKSRDDKTLNIDTPILFLTNMYTDDQYKQAMLIGKDYIIKAHVTPDEFLTRIQKYLPK